jgi:CO/xanthine dehydrogenase Mo-binding subunit
MWSKIDRMHFHRFSSTPLENNVVIGQWNPKDDRIHYWCNNSFPSFAIQFLAAHLMVPYRSIRVQTFDIGGSFGIKITSYPQMAVCALASKKAGGRPVKWVETRSEHMVSSAHGNERTFRDTRVALDKNGVITAIASRHIDDCGAYPRYEPLGCVIWSQVFCGVYRFKNARIDFTQTVTNKCPSRPQSRILAHAAPVVLWSASWTSAHTKSALRLTKCACATTFARKNFPTPRPTAACTTPAIIRKCSKLQKT